MVQKTDVFINEIDDVVDAYSIMVRVFINDNAKEFRKKSLLFHQGIL